MYKVHYGELFLTLRPGEAKILESLRDGPRKNGELRKETGLAKSIFSKYLKDLQRQGLLERDFETREYRAKDLRSLEALYSQDLTDFTQKTLGERFRDRNRDHSSLLSERPLVLCENTELEKRIRSVLQTGENMIAISRIHLAAFTEWENYVLSGFTQTHRNIVRKCQEYLLDIAKVLEGKKKEDSLQLYRLFEQFSMEELSTDYPLAQIPRLMIAIHTARRYREFAGMCNVFDRPASLDDLKRRWLILRETNRMESLSKEDFSRIKERKSYLEDPKNRKVYEKYMEKMEKEQRVLMVSPMLGFAGYLDTLRKYCPEKAATLEKDLEVFKKSISGLSVRSLILDLRKSPHIAYHHTQLKRQAQQSRQRNKLKAPIQLRS